jgi:hypothetical protein
VEIDAVEMVAVLDEDRELGKPVPGCTGEVERLLVDRQRLLETAVGGQDERLRI